MMTRTRRMPVRGTGIQKILRKTEAAGRRKPADLLFTSQQLRALLLPLIIEQFLDTFMGMADTMMVSRVGSTAISAVSLTDSINTLIIQVFIALAAGGTILCSQYLGQKNSCQCSTAARQLILTLFGISMVVSFFCLAFRGPLLKLIFGKVSRDVMDASLVYFLITSLSIPFIALFQGGGALYRAMGNSRLPMLIAAASNLLNIGGNAILIFVLHMGVRGAAISTLASRIWAFLVIFGYLRKAPEEIRIDHYASMRPQYGVIRKILHIGVPAGVENGMFQFGKLAIQSSVSTLGTTAIAAQAMAAIFEMIDGVGGIGIGIGLMTIIGTCMGAGRKDQAVYYTKRLAFDAEAAIAGTCFLVFLLGKPIIMLAGMEAGAGKLAYDMLIIITICKPLLWVPSFIPPYSFRAAGDVRYSMIISSASMWICRVALTIFLIQVLHFGIVAVWIGMFTDWFVRGIIYTIHFFRKKWLSKM